MTQQAKLSVLLSLKDQATAGLKNATKSIKDHQAAFRKASLMMAGAAAVLGGAVYAAARAGRDYDNTLNALRGTVERTGIQFGTIEKPLDDMATRFASIGNYTKTEVLETFQDLINMTGNVDDAFLLLKLTLDRAAEGNMSLESAARNVSNAVKHGTGELLQYIPELSEATSETDRLRLVSERYTGALEANADPVKLLTSNLNDMMVSLGVWKIISNAAEALSGLSSALNNLPEWAAPFIGATLVGAFLAFTAGAGLAAFAASGFGIALIGATIAAAPFIGIGAAIALAVGLIVVGILLLRKHWDEVWGFIKDTFNTISDIVEGAYRSKWGWLLPGGALVKAILFIKDHWDEIWNTIKETYTTVTDKLKEITTGVIDFLKGGWEGLYGAVKSVINRIIGVVNDMIRGVNKISFDMPFGGPKIGFDIPEIPKLAAGGIIRRPTVGLLGEHGPEAVVPLGARGGLGGNVIINFPAQGTVILDNEASARRLASELTRLIRGELRSQRGW